MIAGTVLWEGQHDGANYRVLSPEADNVRDFVVYEDVGDQWVATDDGTAYLVLCKMLAQKVEEGAFVLGTIPRHDVDAEFQVVLTGRACVCSPPGRARRTLAEVRNKLEAAGALALRHLAGAGMKEMSYRVQTSGDLEVAARLEKQLEGT